MTKRTKIAWLAMALSAASAPATTYTGDLILGFSNPNGGTDFLYDLGPASALTPGEQWNLGASLSGFNLATVNWGIIGDMNLSGTRVAWTTTGGATPSSIPSSGVWGTLDTPTKSIFQNFAGTGAGQTLSISSADQNSWNAQTINGALATQYVNAYENPNVVGFEAASFFDVFANASAPVLQGTFTLNANGTVTFVPEPSGLGLVAGFGLLGLMLRRRAAR